jgi:septal ring factor EnvC (AmiA/AmiB activator)
LTGYEGPTDIALAEENPPTPERDETSEPDEATSRPVWLTVLIVLLLLGLLGGLGGTAYMWNTDRTRLADNRTVLGSTKGELARTSDELRHTSDDLEDSKEELFTTAARLNESQEDVADLEERLGRVASEKAQAQDQADLNARERDAIGNVALAYSRATTALQTCLSDISDVLSWPGDSAYNPYIGIASADCARASSLVEQADSLARQL